MVLVVILLILFDLKNISMIKHDLKNYNEFNKITNHRRKLEYLASRFAVKEAMSKALGVGISKEFSFHDIEVKKDEKGKPYIEYSGYISHVTISHTDSTAIAFVVLERED